MVTATVVAKDDPRRYFMTEPHPHRKAGARPL
jgi:hypothetical protein